MHIFRLMSAVALVGSTLALDAPAARADLTVNSWDFFTGALDGSGASVADSTVNNPFSSTTTVAFGGASSTTTYDFAWDAATGGSFNWSFDHQRVGGPSSFAQSFTSDPFTFTITGQDMLYDLSGAYSMTGDKSIHAFVRLLDPSAGLSFNWGQVSKSTSGQSFDVGRRGDGDTQDYLTGSTSGTLLAGHTYELEYTFLIADTAAGSVAATATGNLRMNITPVPVPAPGSALLAMIGLPLVGWMKRRFA